MNVFLRSAVALLGTLFGSASLPAAQPQPTHEFVLDNGLKVVVREDHRAPVVVSQIWYRVGSSYEAPGSTGLSHAMEHMMFKGSRKLGPGEASRVLRDLGAEENAFTSDDYTAYYQTLARDRLPVALEIEADRMAHLSLPEPEFAKEIEVIKEERRWRVDDQPLSLAYERFRALAYPASGYHTPTLGWMADLERMKVAQLRAWYQAWYAPNNATLVVVGDVTEADVKPLVERYFQDIPRRPLAPAKRPLELAEPGERRTTLRVRTELPALLMGFNTPGLATAKEPRQVWALYMISNILDGGDSARLDSELVRGQASAINAAASFDPFTRGDSLFVLSGVPNQAKGQRNQTLEATFWEQLERLKNHPVSPEEMARVRAQLISSLVYGRDAIDQQATSIGALASVGLDWRLADGQLQRLQEVTAKDIQSAARQFFIRSRLTVAYVLPQEARHGQNQPD